MRATAVLFDLDGTLADTVPAIVDSYQHAFSTVLGQDLDAAYLRSRIGIPLDVQLAAVGGEEHLPALRAAYLEHNLAMLPSTVRAFAGMDELIRLLHAHEIPLGVVTSKRRHSAEVTLAACGLDIALLVASEDGPHKPAPDPLLLGCAKLGIAADARVCYIGDTELDIVAANAAGLTSVAVSWGARERDALVAANPARLFDDVSQLSQFLVGPPASTD